MPPKRNQCRKNNIPSTSVAGAMANCVFPQDVMVSILTRLPVKSIVRFKSVCKPWFKLFATPRFVKMHQAQFSNNPENQSVVIYSLSDYHDHTMSLFKIDSGERTPVALDHPYPEIFFRMDFVGSCNGLICMGCPPIGQAIVLWNPAMKLFKFVRLSKKIEPKVTEEVSLGFGYDEEGVDFKVARVVRLRKKGNKMGVAVEVYSSITDSWRVINVGFHFSVQSTTNDAIVNGNPYWVAKVDGNVESLVCFDVKKMEFKVVPLSGLNLRADVLLVDWKGSLGAVVSKKMGEGRVESLDVWVLDDVSWSKKLTFGLGRIDLNVSRFLQCSNNGKIWGEFPNGKLFVLDSETGRIKEVVIDEAQKGSFVIHGYAESLAFVDGMQKVVVKKGIWDIAADEDGGAEAEVEGDDVGTLFRSYLHFNLGN